MKKLQLINLVVVGLQMLLFWIVFANMWRELPVAIILPLLLTIYFLGALFFYFSDLEQNDYVQLACVLTILFSLPIIALILIVGSAEVADSLVGAAIGGFILLAMIPYSLIVLASSILFIVGYFKARNLILNK